MNFPDKIFATIKSLGKIILKSGPTKIPEFPGGDTLYILANGPSLSKELATRGEFLKNSTTLAVNFAFNSPEIREIRPSLYVLADPHFFGDTDPNVKTLRENLVHADYPISIFVPKRYLKTARKQLPGAHLYTFNDIGVEGFDSVACRAYSLRLGMPRPRNVLIPSIMIGIWCGFKNITLLGADHSWLKTLSVTDENEVVSIQPHFYSDSKDEMARVRHEYRNIPLHSVLESMTIAFRAYHQIENYASKKGVTIINATPDSFIDAFRRPNNS